ncbi:MAG: acyl-ACP--UDP-N-acetylglucosamine O-acyltransferase [Acidobacteria bacterium]|nr:acyl-ACP--UDP-N-acetylglucosamine O-acyltransferase [Acidobacteriota bacterium]
MPIHPSAIVSPKAEIANTVNIGPYAIIGDDVILHDDIEIGAHACVDGPCEIGRATRLFPYACLGQIPQDLKFKGEYTKLIVGERNVFREFVTVHRGTLGGGGITRVGNDNFFMAQSHIAHDCIVGDQVIFANGASLAGHVIVDDCVTIGAYSGIHQFCRIGKHAFIGAYSVVVKNALPYARSVGNHAKCYGPNTIGLKRRGFSDELLKQIGHAFKLLLTSKLNTSQALEKIKEELGAVSEIDYLIKFIESSERGVIK